MGDLRAGANGAVSRTFVGRFNAETVAVAVGQAPTSKPRGQDDAGRNPAYKPIHTFHLGSWFNSTAEAKRAGCSMIETPVSGERDAGVQVLSTCRFGNSNGPLRQPIGTTLGTAGVAASLSRPSGRPPEVADAPCSLGPAVQSIPLRASYQHASFPAASKSRKLVVDAPSESNGCPMLKQSETFARFAAKTGSSRREEHLRPPFGSVVARAAAVSWRQPAVSDGAGTQAAGLAQAHRRG